MTVNFIICLFFSKFSKPHFWGRFIITLLTYRVTSSGLNIYGLHDSSLPGHRAVFFVSYWEGSIKQSIYG